MKIVNGKKGRIPLAVLLSGILIGNIVIMETKERPEETQAHAEPVLTETVTEYKTAVYRNMKVPDGDTAFKSYMDYGTITNKRSAQYKLQAECWTDKNGLRRYDDMYVIALGTYYTDSIGEQFKITLDTGKTFKAVVGDFKADRHTDKLNQYTPMDGRKCVCEFVVDVSAMPKKAKRMGDVSYIEGFDGDIDKIERLE